MLRRSPTRPRKGKGTCHCTNTPHYMTLPSTNCRTKAVMESNWQLGMQLLLYGALHLGLLNMEWTQLQVEARGGDYNWT